MCFHSSTRIEHTDHSQNAPINLTDSLPPIINIRHHAAPCLHPCSSVPAEPCLSSWAHSSGSSQWAPYHVCRRHLNSECDTGQEGRRDQLW